MNCIANNKNLPVPANIPINEPRQAYREIPIGKITVRLTSVFLGNKDLNKTLERLAIEKVLNAK